VTAHCTADALQAGASQFEASAGKLKRKFWWKNMKVNISLCSSCWYFYIAVFFAYFIVRMVPEAFLGNTCVCVIIYNKGLLTHLNINYLQEFHQICYLGAVGAKDELVRFWGQKVNTTVKPYIFKLALRKHFFTCFRRAWMQCNETSPGTYNTDGIFKVIVARI